MAPTAEVLSPQNGSFPTQYYSPSIQQKFGIITQAKPEPLASRQPYADIGFAFDERKFQERTKARLQRGGLETQVPIGWPEKVHGPLVWTGSDFSDESSFVYCLTDADKQEVVAALIHFRSLRKQDTDVERSTFPLPTLGHQLSHICDDVYEGRGFAILRGLDIDSFNTRDLVTVYLGITSYIANKRGKQNHEGAMLINVVNTSPELSDENAHIEQPFHTDLVCDVVSMLTKSCGSSGGSSIVTSSWTVYNELASTRPDLIHVLAKPDWPFDTFGREPACYRRPLLYFQDGRIIMNFSRRTLVGHAMTDPRTPGIPGLTEEQAEALDAIHAVGCRHELKTSLKKGDIRFINNMGLMHRRNTFKDDNKNQRHLLRLWLHNDSRCWKLPPTLSLAWERIFADRERCEQWEIARLNEEGRLVGYSIWEDTSPEGNWDGSDTPPRSKPNSIQHATSCD